MFARNLSSSIDLQSDVQLLSGPNIPPERLALMRKENLQRILALANHQDGMRDGNGKPLRLQMKRQLYTGHYSDVYLVQASGHRKYPKLFALKIVDRERCPKQSNFENELQVCRTIQEHPHPNLVPVIKLRQFNRPSVFFALFMPYGGHFSLDRFISECFPQKRIPNSMAKYLFRQMCEAMAHLHRLDIVHRDLKPENILVLAERSGCYPIHFRIWLIDFGFAKRIERSDWEQQQGANKQALCTSHKGTLDHMAPELLENHFYYDAFRIDIYALGVIFYHMLYGQGPFQLEPEGHCSTFAEMLYEYRRLKNQAIPFPELHDNDNDDDEDPPGPDTKLLIRKMLDRKPEQRPHFAEILQSGFFETSVTD